MDYYRCPNAELLHEIQRRGYKPYGNQDQLSEGLRKDDDYRGNDATTVETITKAYVPPKVNLMRTAEFGKTIPASLLVGERIIHWTMNTFFPTLQLFFESGLSCTIDGGRLSDAAVDLDPKLRFRLTDCTHEEDGLLVKTPLPEKFVGPTPSIGILEAVIGQRTSIAVKYVKPKPPEINGLLSPPQLQATIVQEVHMVVGLRLEGMDRMEFVWAKTSFPTTPIADRTWGDVRIAGLRDDIPVPFFGFPQKQTKAGGEAVVVTKKSMVKEPKKKPFGRR